MTVDVTLKVQHLKRTPAEHKPATDTFSVEGVLVEANAHRGFACYQCGKECVHVKAVEQAIKDGKVPQLEEWNRVVHWG